MLKKSRWLNNLNALIALNGKEVTVAAYNKISRSFNGTLKVAVVGWIISDDERQ